MNARQTEIMALLDSRGDVRTRALASRFAVTPMTIRRDLDALSRSGRVERTHGGAIRSREAVVEFAFSERRRRCGPQKQAIGSAIASMFEPGMTVVLDSGTTTLEVARAMAAMKGVTVLTTSLAIASALYASGGVEVVLLGGSMRKNSPDLSGFLAEENLRRFAADVAVLGADAAAPQGVYTTDISVARTSAAMLACARRRILAADSSKFGARALFRYAGWRDFHLVVTDPGLTPETGRWLRKAVADVQEVFVARGRGAPHGG